MTSKEFEETYHRISKQVVQDLFLNAKSNVLEELKQSADENGKIDLQNSQIALTVFAMTSAVKFTDKLLFAVLKEMFVND